MLCNHHAIYTQTFSSSPTKTLYPLNNNSSFPLLPALGNHHSTFCLYEFACAKYLV